LGAALAQISRWNGMRLVKSGSQTGACQLQDQHDACGLRGLWKWSPASVIRFWRDATLDPALWERGGCERARWSMLVSCHAPTISRIGERRGRLLSESAVASNRV